MRMLRDNLLVKQLTKEQMGKIVLPQNSMEDDWLRGKVIAAGPGLRENGTLVPMGCEVDDIIVFPPMPGGGRYPTVNVDGEDLMIFNDRYVWAIEETD